MSGVDDELLLLGATEQARLIRSRELSPVELVQACLRRIETLDPLNAWLTVDAELALAGARRCEHAAHDAGRPGRAPAPLLGLPVGIKDLDDTADLPTTYGSLAYAEHRPSRDSVVAERLKAAGAIVIGKTNTPAFGLLGETKNRLRGPCSNPRDPALTSGGSSGGSAVAALTGMASLATGTDSGGSISAPAALCGLVGFKSSSGRIPIAPAPADSLLLNHEGTLTRTVADAILALSVLAGHDPRDPISLRAPLAPLAEHRLGDVRLAYCSSPHGAAIEPEIDAVVRGAAAAAGADAAGYAELEPFVDDVWETFDPIFLADVQAGLGHVLADHADELYPETHAELAPLGALTPADVARAIGRRARLRAVVAELFERFDLLSLPATAVTAFPHGQPPSAIGGRPVSADWRSFMPHGVLWDLTGCPVVSLPCGRSGAGLPIGIMLVAAPGADQLLLSCAEDLEARLGVQRDALIPL